MSGERGEHVLIHGGHVPYGRHEHDGSVICGACGERFPAEPIDVDTDEQARAVYAEHPHLLSSAREDLRDPGKAATFRYSQHFTAAAEAEKGGS